MANQKKLGSRWREIQSYADGLHHELIRDCVRLWQGAPPVDDVQLLKPGIALGILGYTVETSQFLGDFPYEGKRTEIAGLIETSGKLVKISNRFSPQEQLFTTAHELGHAVLGHSLEVMHRDRPLTGSDCQRDWRECEADWFATCFLMPRDLVRDRFIRAFATDNFTLTDASAFALAMTSVEKILGVIKETRGLSRKLAEATYYNGKHFSSLASTFGVSATAMAIRLEELGLVAPLIRGCHPPPFLSTAIR